MLQILVILVSVHFQRSLPAAYTRALGSRQNPLLIGMAQSLFPGVSFLVEHIVLHIGFLLFILTILITGIEYFVHQSVYNRLLLVRQAVEDVSDGFPVTGFLLFVLDILIDLLIGMLKLDKLASVNEPLLPIFFHRAIAVHDHRINESARIRAGEHQADLANHAVNHVQILLLQLIGINRERRDVAMLNQRFRVLAAFGRVERAIRINTFVPVFKKRVTEHTCGLVVLVVPYQRHLSAVTIFESISQDCSAVRATQIVSGCPAAKIEFLIHFDLFPPLFWCQAIRKGSAVS